MLPDIFYWTAILFSNTLGTALGDFLADSSGLAFLGGAILIGALLGLVVLTYYFTQINRVILFWIAFVLTRPFGATFGDVLTKPIERDGLNLGTIGSSHSARVYTCHLRRVVDYPGEARAGRQAWRANTGGA